MSEYIVDVNDSSKMYAVEMGRYEELCELIRCRECIHHHGHDCENMNYRWTSDDFYCGWAERKEE